MSPTSCLAWPDRRLRQRAEPVEAITDDIRRIWDEMIEVMEAMPGVGLAAPQIGVMLRLAVVDASSERGQAVRMANPKNHRCERNHARTRGGQPLPSGCFCQDKTTARRFGEVPK